MREKQQAHAAASPTKEGKGGKAVPLKKNGKERAADPPADPPSSPPAPARAAGLRGGASQVSNAAQDVLEEALAVVRNRTLDNEKTPPPSPPAQRGLTERQKKAEEQRARNEATVVADLNARLVAEVDQLTAAQGAVGKGEEEKSVRSGGSQEAAAETVQRESSKAAGGDMSLQSFSRLPFF